MIGHVLYTEFGRSSYNHLEDHHNRLLQNLPQQFKKLTLNASNGLREDDKSFMENGMIFC